MGKESSLRRFSPAQTHGKNLGSKILNGYTPSHPFCSLIIRIKVWLHLTEIQNNNVLSYTKLYFCFSQGWNGSSAQQVAHTQLLFSLWLCQHPHGSRFLATMKISIQQDRGRQMYYLSSISL